MTTIVKTNPPQMVPDWVHWVIFSLCIVIVIMLILIVVVGAAAKKQFDSVKAELDKATSTIDRVRSLLDLLENLLSGGGTRAGLVQLLTVMTRSP